VIASVSSAEKAAIARAAGAEATVDYRTQDLADPGDHLGCSG